MTRLSMIDSCIVCLLAAAKTRFELKSSFSHGRILDRKDASLHPVPLIELVDMCRRYIVF